jgi:cytoskeletal protein CcmA (bactofilin family)
MAASGNLLEPILSVIARSARVRGRLTGDGDLEIRGFVEGEIVVGGDVTVEADGLVAAPVRGRRVTVRGAVRGDLVGEDAIVIEAGGRVVGDLRSPRIALAEGALVRGLVETAGADEPTPAPRRAVAGRPAPATVARPTVVGVPAPRASAPMAAAVPRPAMKTEVPAVVETLHGASDGGRDVLRRPPPPVVPALKKMRGQIVKKKDR